MSFNLTEEVRRAVEETLKKRGRANIVIAGRSGVGKSTLINAVFQGQMAETGQGRPVTRDVREITKGEIPLSIFDTRGLELDRYAETVKQLEELVVSRQREIDPSRHIHVAWLCISEDSRRVEEGESSVARLLSSRVPLVVVITKARSDQGFRSKVEELVPVQLGMLATITGIFGLSLTEGFLVTLLGGAVTAVGATIAGQQLASGLLKLLPGAGSVAGGAIAAATAASLTTAFGEAYIAALHELFQKSGGEPPTLDAISKAFRDRLRQVGARGPAE